jgi:hypothetical protein
MCGVLFCSHLGVGIEGAGAAFLGHITNVNMIITDYWIPCVTGYELLKRDKVYEFNEVWTPEKGAMRLVAGKII